MANKLSFFVLFAFVLCSFELKRVEATGFVNNSRTISMKRGDVICCSLSPIKQIDHCLLATGPEEFIHFVGDKSDSTGEIIKESRQLYVSRPSASDYCSSRPALIGEESVQLAEKMVGMRVYYDFSGCNCQHFVTAWADKFPLSNSGFPNKKCIKQFNSVLETEMLSPRFLSEYLSLTTGKFGKEPSEEISAKSKARYRARVEALRKLFILLSQNKKAIT